MTNTLSRVGTFLYTLFAALAPIAFAVTLGWVFFTDSVTDWQRTLLITSTLTVIVAAQYLTTGLRNSSGKTTL